MVGSYRLSSRILEETFAHFRDCGRVRRECQVLWVSPWDAPDTITRAIHPEHDGVAGGFVLHDQWLNDFWFSLGQENLGIRCQVHTHPRAAFHSATDDAFPIVHAVGFLSLVIPNFAQGPIGFDGAYLAEIQLDGRWRQVAIAQRLVIT
jgi:hypothetical protein